MEDFRKLVERKVTERREEKEKHPEKLRKWSITKTIVQENIECDVTIKVKYTECIGHVSPLHLPPSCVLFVLCFFSSRKLLPELHACITLSLSLSMLYQCEDINFLFKEFLASISAESKEISSKCEFTKRRDGIMGLRKSTR